MRQIRTSSSMSGRWKRTCASRAPRHLSTLWGMMRALRESMEAGTKADFTADELIARLVDVEWDERQGRKLSDSCTAPAFATGQGWPEIENLLHSALRV